MSMLKAHSSSLANLRQHVTKIHGSSLVAFEAAVSKGSRRKRPSGGGSVPSAGGKRGGQTSIAAWSSGAGYAALQSGVDTRIVDFFVENMVSLKVIFCLSSLPN
jgi:hypothetical protein